MKRRALLLSLPGLALAKPPAEQAGLLRRLARFNQGFGAAELDAVLEEWRRMRTAGVAGERELGWVVAALMDGGRFDEAEQLGAELPGWAQRSWPRRQRIAAGPRHCWRLDGEQLRELDIGAQREPQVWVLAAHGCGFCRLAAQQLGADELLGPLLARHSLWLAPGSDLFRIDSWAQRYPSFPLRLLTDRTGWPLPSGWATPRFLFVREGQPLQQFAGWPPDGSQRAALVDGLTRIALL